MGTVIILIYTNDDSFFILLGKHSEIEFVVYSKYVMDVLLLLSLLLLCFIAAKGSGSMELRQSSKKNTKKYKK